jgi:hypothetical protein
LFGISAIEIFFVEVAIGLLLLEHVIHDHQDRVAHGDDSAFLTFARS